jgi:nucleotide-binding universal stress UspA family protein
MLRRFLIPIDFTTNTDIAINKAIELIDTENAVIHLLHVNNNLYSRFLYAVHSFLPFTKTKTNNYHKENSNLEKLKMKIARRLPRITVQTEFVLGDIEKNIINAIKRINPDIIIIAKHQHQASPRFLKTISPERIARRTGRAILTVKSGSANQLIRDIVVPVDSLIPNRKIDVLSLLSKKFNIKIHLVCLSSKSTPVTVSNALLQTYRMLRSHGLHAQVIYKTVIGTNLYRSTLKYAESIKAEMLLMNKEAELPVSSIQQDPATDKLLENRPLAVVKPFSFLYLK